MRALEAHLLRSAVFALILTAGAAAPAQEVEGGNDEEQAVIADDGVPVAADDLMLMPEPTVRRSRPFAWDLRAGASGVSLRLGRSGGASPLALRVDDRGRRGGALSLAAGSWTLRTGTLRVDHGFGLLARGAGRWRRVSASSALPSPRAGVGSYTGVDPDRRLTGVALSHHGGGFRGDLLLSGFEGSSAADDDRIWAARLGSGGISLAAVGSPTGLGGSLVLEREWEQGRWALEAAHSGGEGRGRTAGACRAAWKGKRRGLEALFVVGEELAAPLSDNLLLVPGPRGSAWALRGHCKVGARGRWNLLLSRGGAERERSGLPGRETRLRMEVSTAWRTPRGVRLTARLRRDGDRRRGWAEVHAWDPPAGEWNRVAWSLSQRAAGDWRDWALAASMASRWYDDGAGVRSRSLIHIQGDRPLGSAGKLRLGYTWSWGGALDLMTADAPAPGLLAVRHARYLRSLWTVGWTGTYGGIRAVLALEALERGDQEGNRRRIGVRIRFHGGL